MSRFAGLNAELKYIITPEGIALRAHLTLDYIQSSLSLYRLVRERSLKAIQQIHKAGLNEVCIIGSGDVADICKLTCLEQNLVIRTDEGCKAIIRIEELKLYVDFILEEDEPV